MKRSQEGGRTLEHAGISSDRGTYSEQTNKKKKEIKRYSFFRRMNEHEAIESANNANFIGREEFYDINVIKSGKNGDINSLINRDERDISKDSSI